MNKMRTVLLEESEEFTVPQNCWVFEELEDGTKRLVTSQVVKASQRTRLKVVPKAAGG